MTGEGDEWIQVGPYRLTPDQLRQFLGDDGDGLSLWLLNEAAWSVKMSQDPRAQTYSLEDLPPKSDTTE